MPFSDSNPKNIKKQKAPKTPGEWFIYFIQKSHAAEKEPAALPAILIDENKETERLMFFLQANGASWPVEKLGKNAKYFIQMANGMYQQNEWIAPVDAFKISHLFQYLEGLNKDLTADPIWENYWKELIDYCKNLPEFYHEEKINRVIGLIKKQILVAYQLRVIQACTLLPKNKSMLNEEKSLAETSYREFLQQMGYAIYRYTQEKAEAVLTKNATQYLQKAMESELQYALLNLRKGKLLLTISLIKQALQRLEYTQAYELLGNERSQAILAPLANKLKAYEEMVLAMNNMIIRISSKAKPGVEIEADVRQEIKNMNQEGMFTKTPEIGPSAIAKFLNTQNIFRLIHETSINIRVEHCAPYLKISTDNFKLLKVEIRKVTMSRLRRYLIRKLFEIVMNEHIKSKQPMTAEQEACLRLLQEEFVTTLFKQIERVDPVRARTFLESYEYDPIIRMFPDSTGGSALDELHGLTKGAINKGFHQLYEEAPLHSTESPIEINVLGEISRQLMQIASLGKEEMEDKSVILHELEHTYHTIEAPDFQPDPMLVHLIITPERYDILKKRLLHEENILLRIKKIDVLSQHILSIESLTKPQKNWLIWKKPNPALEKAIAFLGQLYIDSLKTALSHEKINSQRDKYIIYSVFLQKALHSPLMQSAKRMSKTKQYYRECIKLLKTLSDPATGSNKLVFLDE